MWLSIVSGWVLFFLPFGPACCSCPLLHSSLSLCVCVCLSVSLSLSNTSLSLSLLFLLFSPPSLLCLFPSLWPFSIPLCLILYSFFSLCSIHPFSISFSLCVSVSVFFSPSLSALSLSLLLWCMCVCLSLSVSLSSPPSTFPSTGKLSRYSDTPHSFTLTSPGLQSDCLLQTSLGSQPLAPGPVGGEAAKKSDKAPAQGCTFSWQERKEELRRRDKQEASVLNSPLPVPSPNFWFEEGWSPISTNVQRFAGKGSVFTAGLSKGNGSPY